MSLFAQLQRQVDLQYHVLEWHPSYGGQSCASMEMIAKHFSEVRKGATSLPLTKMDYQTCRSYVGISRTRRALAHGGRLLSKIHQHYDKTISTTTSLSTPPLPVSTAFNPSNHPPSKSPLKSTVEKLYHTDRNFATWLLELLCIPSSFAMPHDVSEDPTPALQADFPSLSDAA